MNSERVDTITRFTSRGKHSSAKAVLIGLQCLGLLVTASTEMRVRGAAGQVAPLVAGAGQVPRDERNSSVLRGTVVAADTGQPIRNAAVRLVLSSLGQSSTSEAASPRVARTRANGEYDFDAVPRGRYIVSASKSTYIPLSYGQKVTNTAPKLIDINGEPLIQNINIALPKGAVLAGTTLDEFGDPVEAVQVRAMRLTGDLRSRVTPAGNVSASNDLGEFRVSGLLPGRYALVATLHSVLSERESDDRRGYAPTYYPGTANPTEAQIVNVSVGDTLSGLTITLSPTPLLKVSGFVFNADGTPLSSGTVTIATSRGRGIRITMGSAVDSSGAFVIYGVAPGNYKLIASSPSGPGNVVTAGSTSVVVEEQDVVGVQVTLENPITLSGRLVFSPTATLGRQPSRLRLALMPDESSALNGRTSMQVGDDQTFSTFVQPPGIVRIIIADDTSTWSIRQVLMNGRDVIDDGIAIHSNENVRDVEVEVTDQQTDLDESAADARGNAVVDYRLLVFSRDRARWHWPSRYIRVATPNADGRCDVRGLPAGDYFMVAARSAESPDLDDPDLFERVSNKATTVSLRDGEKKVLVLSVIDGF